MKEIEIPLSVLKAMSRLPMSREEIDEVVDMKHTDLIIEYGLDSLQAHMACTWTYTEAQRQHSQDMSMSLADAPERKPYGAHTKTYPLKESLRRLIKKYR